MRLILFLLPFMKSFTAKHVYNSCNCKCNIIITFFFSDLLCHSKLYTGTCRCVPFTLFSSVSYKLVISCQHQMYTQNTNNVVLNLGTESCLML